MFFVFFLSCACGTSQGPKSNSDLASGNFTYKSLTAGEKDKLAEEIRVKYDKLLGKNLIF